VFVLELGHLGADLRQDRLELNHPGRGLRRRSISLLRVRHRLALRLLSTHSPGGSRSDLLGRVAGDSLDLGLSRTHRRDMRERHLRRQYRQQRPAHLHQRIVRIRAPQGRMRSVRRDASQPAVADSVGSGLARGERPASQVLGPRGRSRHGS
jgi:hypothetical protein